MRADKGIKDDFNELYKTDNNNKLVVCKEDRRGLTDQLIIELLLNIRLELVRIRETTDTISRD